ncbi:hypothetical protein NQ314_019701 [Rhamnusium bicolor]|uniref:G protein gamma domain-containing protein n=1 Tax=Rhamnusium bicolor TaxID=1586634 RepID=A0AAV8WM63_9CUCU|nr:hypothetical protein NQ314_019701 [Rhamnusium bicolor]
MKVCLIRIACAIQVYVLSYLGKESQLCYFKCYICGTNTSRSGAVSRALFVASVLIKFFTIGLSDTALMDMVVSNLQQQRLVTEQLRREAAIKRMPVSLAVKDIIRYITEHEQDDCLLVGFSSQRVNPFREKTPCTVL